MGDVEESLLGWEGQREGKGGGVSESGNGNESEEGEQAKVCVQ